MENTDSYVARKFGELLRKSRELKDMTQQEVADRLGITQSYYQRLEQGKRNAPISLVIQLCKFYEIDFTQFMSLIEIENRKATR